jgi:ATP-dependent Clp protease ATP-binding subunit ClpA
MFERYTEKARRVIFFARYEASQFGSPYIETEHLLLGLLREDKALTNRFLRSHASVESIRKQIEGHTTIREKVSTSVDLPLSNECKRVLAYAAEEAERLSHKHIGTEHLLAWLCCARKNALPRRFCTERGLRLPAIRDELQRTTQEKVPVQQSSKAQRSESEPARRVLPRPHPERHRPAARSAGRPRRTRSNASSRSSAAAQKTIPSSSVSPASARRPSSKAWRRRSPTAKSPASSQTSASSRSTSRSSSPAQSIAASLKSA